MAGVQPHRKASAVAVLLAVTNGLPAPLTAGALLTYAALSESAALELWSIRWLCVVCRPQRTIAL